MKKTPATITMDDLAAAADEAARDADREARAAGLAPAGLTRKPSADKRRKRAKSNFARDTSKVA